MIFRQISRSNVLNATNHSRINSRVRDEHELGFKESAEKSDGGESASDDVEEEVDQQEWILWHHNQQGAPE